MDFRWWTTFFFFINKNSLFSNIICVNRVFLKWLLYSNHQCGSWLFGPLLGRKCRDWTSKLQVNTDALCLTTEQHIQIAVICQTAREVKFFIYCSYSIPVLLHSCIYHLHLSVLPGWDFQWATVCERERKRASGSQGLVCICLWSIKLIGLLGHVVYNGLISLSSIKYSLLFSPLSRGNMTLTTLDSTSELTSATLACYWHFNPVFFSLNQCLFHSSRRTLQNMSFLAVRTDGRGSLPTPQD